MDYCIAEAARMLESFVSVGAGRFDVTRTTIDKQGRGIARDQSPAQTRRLLNELTDGCIRERLNLIIRPQADPPLFLIQLDDIAAGQLERVRSLAFMVIRTSAAKPQAWLAVERCDPSLPQRVKKAVDSDMGANGWVRVAGTLNVKPQYAPNFPTVSIEAVQLGLKVMPAQLHVLGLVAPSDPIAARDSLVRGNGRKPKRFPDYLRFLNGAPLTAKGEKDRSKTDFTFCCAALRWGWSVEETADQLVREPLSKAAERGPDYAWDTTVNAARAVGLIE